MFFALGLWPHGGAYASEALHFAPLSHSKQDQALIAHAGFNDGAVAIADLNEDGLDEYIVKSADCPAQCRYFVFAQSGGDALLLIGEITGTSLLLGNTYSHGVRDILAFDNSLNDFDHHVYGWDAEQSRYALKQGGVL
ncbi:MAG: hypothetical protein ACPGRX_03855 [Bdellovibrionales bacterium]